MSGPVERIQQDAKLARELESGELRTVIEEGVYRGVLKAVGVYVLLSFLGWVLISVVASSMR